ncbi:hypothetical protein T484DRAFT_1949463 [Baffinella frigidus]|nr:hypothetical protein T484DRAFT_1949463 [Cryptophyta sp. CCMP2293]
MPMHGMSSTGPATMAAVPRTRSADDYLQASPVVQNTPPPCASNHRHSSCQSPLATPPSGAALWRSHPNFFASSESFTSSRVLRLPSCSEDEMSLFDEDGTSSFAPTSPGYSCVEPTSPGASSLARTSPEASCFEPTSPHSLELVRFGQRASSAEKEENIVHLADYHALSEASLEPTSPRSPRHSLAAVRLGQRAKKVEDIVRARAAMKQRFADYRTLCETTGAA